jgi:hypothetical protein
MLLSSQRRISNLTRGSLFQITTFIESVTSREETAELPLQSHPFGPTSLHFVESTGVCIIISSSDNLLAAFYTSPGRTWSDFDIIELLSFGNKCILAGTLHAEYPFSFLQFT